MGGAGAAVLVAVLWLLGLHRWFFLLLGKRRDRRDEDDEEQANAPGEPTEA